MLCWEGRAAARGRASCRCADATTWRTRWPPPRCAWRVGSTPRRCGPGCAASPACLTAWRRWRAGTACCSSTTPRRPTSASTLVALEAMAAERLPVHLILGGQGKGQDFTALRGPDRGRLPRRLPDRRGRGGDRAGDAGERRWWGRAIGGEQCGDARSVHVRTRPRARSPSPRPSTVRSCCSRRAARASTSSPTSKLAASASASSSDSCSDCGPDHGAHASDAEAMEASAAGVEEGSDVCSRTALQTLPRARKSRAESSPRRRLPDSARAAAGVQHPADGHSLPARLRGGHGLQRLLGQQRCWRAAAAAPAIS